MKDKEFLIWIHEKLVLLGDDPLMDYMHKLRAIVTGIPDDQETPNDGRGKNNIKQLMENKYD